MKVTLHLSESELVALLKRIQWAPPADQPSAPAVTPPGDTAITLASAIYPQLRPAHLATLQSIYDAGAVGPQHKKSRSEMRLIPPPAPIRKDLLALGLVDSEPKRLGICITQLGVECLTIHKTSAKTTLNDAGTDPA